jgi:cell division septum initiation protein DivIVA
VHVALDRQSIEKKDFPIGRRGYEPAAVDAHLTAVSEEVEELKRSARRRTESLASASSEQVRAIVDAAENSAAEIHRLAEEDAREMRSDANSEAKATRDQATAQAREYVDKVSQATADLLGRIDAMQNELGALFESLKAGTNRLNADLQLLEGNLEHVREAAAPQRFEAEPAGAGAPAVAAAPAAPTSRGDGPIDHEAETAAELYGVDPDELAAATASTQAAEAGGATVHRDPAAGADDTEGARLIALNMALDGTAREETDRYLAEHFKLSDRGALLDEVYASVEG